MNRVLIIEDDAVARRQLCELFRFENFDVSEADSGQAGIAAAASVAPDLIVCDIMMPGTDGFGVLQAVRKQADTALTPFIFLTAKAAARDVRQGMGQGADDYITKPFDPDALLASARQRLARRRVQIEEAEKRAADTSMLASAALPREMEGCLAQIEAISEVMAAHYPGHGLGSDMGTALKHEISRLRRLSQRLRLYGELPSLYARRFAQNAGVPANGSPQIAIDTAVGVAKQWDRAGDLSVSAADTPVPLSADTLEIIVRELVDNACKFSKRSSPIKVEMQPDQACWKILVSDCGTGMPAQQIREIGAFKQFWSGPERPNGLGLGLVLVQALTRLHSGELLIESAPNAGTDVTVMVPSE